MKKTAITIVGLSLFVAGYQHTRRHAAYIATQQTVTTSANVPLRSLSPPQFKNTLTYRLINTY